MPKLLRNGDDEILGYYGRTGKMIEIQLCRVELEMMLKNMNEYPSADNWVAGRNGDTWVKIIAVDNFGVE